jgi:hypothetical protein
VARVTEILGDGKVKSKDAIGWKILSEGAKLYENDHVFTLDASHMKLEFYDGTILNLTPNTLLIMFKDGEKLDLDLQKGFMGLKLADIKNQLIVRLGEKQIGLNGQSTKLHLQVDQDKTSNLTVVSGEASVSYKGQSLELKRGQKIDLEPNATKVEVTKFGIEPRSPDVEKIYFQQESTKVNLAWDSETRHEAYQVIAARDPQFQNVIKDEQVKQQQASIDVKEEGHYYWKVHGLEAKKQVAEAPVSTFQAKRDGPPTLLFPSAGDVIQLDAGAPGKNVTLRWEESSASQFEVEFFRYELSVAKGELINANETYLELTELGPKEYKWRVRALASDRPSAPWSEFRTFSIREKVVESGIGPQGPRRRQEYFDEKSGKWMRR